MQVLKKSMNFMTQKNVFIGLVLMALERGLREGWECCVTIGPGFSFCHENHSGFWDACIANEIQFDGIGVLWNQHLLDGWIAYETENGWMEF